MKSNLSTICDYRKGKVDVATLTHLSYISTENMLPNKGGITSAASLPTISQTQEYRKGDVLVSNIRPYFKKIWKAKTDGGCSNDVLVFAAKDGTDPDFLYYVLADDSFFEYSMATSNTATTVPATNKPQPNSVNSFTVACTHSRSNTSEPILPIISKKSAIAP